MNKVYTGGSATNAVLQGGAGVYIRYLSRREKKEALPTGLHCTNYRAEMEALIHAAHTISCEVQEDEQVVFLTDAMSVLQATINNKLSHLKKALSKIKCLRITLQWIPAHCGIDGNEEADNLAKMGANKEQKDNKVRPSETNTIINVSVYNTPEQGKKQLPPTVWSRAGGDFPPEYFPPEDSSSICIGSSTLPRHQSAAAERQRRP